MIVRIGIVIVVLAVLWVLGAINPAELPWQNRNFQIIGLTLLAFIIWSGIESRSRISPYSSLPEVVFTVALVISAVDSFVLELTVIQESYFFRWAGLGLFVLGIVSRVYASRKGILTYHRVGRIFLLIGLPVAFGSLLGLVLAVVAGIPIALREEFPVADYEAEEPAE